MAEKYNKNGYNSGDFKRNASQEEIPEGEHQDGGDAPTLNEKADEYVRELLSEKIKLNGSKFPISTSLIDQELSKVQTNGRVPPKHFKYVDVIHDRPTKVTVKVLVPIKEYPKYNFIGQLLGPKGNTLKQLQEETMCKMSVLGRGSMRDRQKEESLRNSLEPKYAHLTDELHVEITALAPPTEAHARIAYALAEVKKHLTPDSGMATMWQGPHAGPPHRVPQRGPPALIGHPPHVPHASHAPHRPMHAKSKVISILDRARSALESSYPYEDPYSMAPEPPIRGAGRGVSEAEAYYERSGPSERFYEEDSYDYKPEYKTVHETVGSRRAITTTRQQYARASPYGGRPAKPASKKRSG